MKFFYKQLLDVYKEIETELAEKGRSYRVDYVKEAVRILSSQLLTSLKLIGKTYYKLIHWKKL
jgi:hypothetical protein